MNTIMNILAKESKKKKNESETYKTMRKKLKSISKFSESEDQYAGYSKMLFKLSFNNKVLLYIQMYGIRM